MVKTSRATGAAKLRQLAADAASCQDCDLYRNATQTVFGRGPADARIFLVGEQPGDHEDTAGEPFVGPAGRILDKALAEVGRGRDDVYMTNAVKHFKWTAKGKRRIHQRPSAREVAACKPWLEAELAAVDPAVVVALGATAGQALFGSKFRVGAARGDVLDLNGRAVIATIHPSAVLRVQEPADRDEQFAGLVADLRRAVEVAMT
ncbi:MAG TPA: UdgX family uracil-DNA binding protein [Acidimicrobiia bacterium]|jgi:DNA polymerase|nr:UdgX family uracil-DNA binding protein [Acidimicrobiia bacterium]